MPLYRWREDTARDGGSVCDDDNKFPLELCGAGVSFHSPTLPVVHISTESRSKNIKSANMAVL